MPRGKLQDELKKKRGFEAPEVEAYLNLVRTGDRLQTRFLRLFREYGLTPSQYNVLRILRGEGQPMKCMEIAARTVTEVPAITGLIDRLEKTRLVVRRRSDEDRREINVSITAKGLKLLADLDQPVLDLHGALLGHLSRADLAELSRLLEKARAPLDETSD
jgi:DNA-binding MarR family transcriptional regulator